MFKYGTRDELERAKYYFGKGIKKTKSCIKKSPSILNKKLKKSYKYISKNIVNNK